MKGWFKDYYRHSLAARGITTSNPDRFVQRDVKNFFKLKQGTSIPVLKHVDAKFVPKPQEGRYSVVAELRGLNNRTVRRTMIVQKFKNATIEDAVKSAEEFAAKNPDSVVFIGIYVGELDDEPMYQDMGSIRLRRTKHREEVFSATKTIRDKMNKLLSKSDNSLIDNTKDRKFKIKGFKQVHLYNKDRNLQKNLFWIEDKPFLLRDGSDIWVNKKLYDGKEKNHRKLLGMVRRRIK